MAVYKNKDAAAFHRADLTDPKDSVARVTREAHQDSAFGAHRVSTELNAAKSIGRSSSVTTTTLLCGANFVAIASRAFASNANATSNIVGLRKARLVTCSM